MYARIEGVNDRRLQSIERPAASWSKALEGFQDEHGNLTARTAHTSSVGREHRIGSVRRSLPPFVLFFAEDFARPHLLLDRTFLHIDQRIGDEIPVPEGIARSAALDAITAQVPWCSILIRGILRSLRDLAPSQVSTMTGLPFRVPPRWLLHRIRPVVALGRSGSARTRHLEAS
jgi:hypothetical protein